MRTGRELADTGSRLIRQVRRGLPLLAALLAVPAPGHAAGQLSLPVADIVTRYPPYQAFCERRPGECALEGDAVLTASPGLMRRLRETNRDVNAEITFALDIEQYGVEDFWALPRGRGDCEDVALEKRARLAGHGLSRAALRLAFVYHRVNLTAHCVLTVETSSGTYLLDSDTDAIHRWDQAQYDFEARERTDGRWDRYDQAQWDGTWHR